MLRGLAIGLVGALAFATHGARAATTPLRVSSVVPFPYAGSSYAALGSGAGSVWAFVPTTETLYRFDDRTGRLAARIKLGPKPSASVAASEPEGRVVVAGGFVWVADQASRHVFRVSPGSNRVAARLQIADPHDVAFSSEGIWVPQFGPYRVARFDPGTNRLISSLPATGPTSAAMGDGSLWIVAHRSGQVLRVDPRTRATLATITLRRGSDPEVARFGEGALWVSTPGTNSLTRIDPATNTVAVTIPLPAGAQGGLLAIGGGSIWIENFTGVYRIDPHTNAITGRFTVSHPGRCGVTTFLDYPCVGEIAFARGFLWVFDPIGRRLLRVADRG
jgi:streptogramin lyase